MRKWTKDVIVDPHDSSENTLFAGVFNAKDQNGGLYRSKDRGLNWSRILGPLNVESMTISPTDRNRAYVTTEIKVSSSQAICKMRHLNFNRFSDYPFRQPLRYFTTPTMDTKSGSQVLAAAYGFTGALDAHTFSLDTRSL